MLNLCISILKEVEMKGEGNLLENRNSSLNPIFDQILSGLMLLGSVVTGITEYLMLFNPEAKLLEKMPKVSSLAAIDFGFMSALILVGIANAFLVFILKKKALMGFVTGLAIYSLAYLYQILFRGSMERNINELMIPYSMNPAIIIIYLLAMTRQNKREL
jgi:small-conductance mechanosensitive channel